MTDSYRLQNLGRQRAAEHRAAQLAALPGDVLNREARRGGLIVRCHKDSVLCRVFASREGLLFVPAAKIRRTRLTRDERGARQVVAVWDRPPPYWLDRGRSEQIRARCRCHADPQIIETADMLDHIRRGKRRMVVPLR